jgi:hypothetical protein
LFTVWWRDQDSWKCRRENECCTQIGRMKSTGTPHPGLPSIGSDQQLGRDDDPSRTTASRSALSGATHLPDGRINARAARMRAQSERMRRLPLASRHGMATRSSSLEPMRFVGMTGGVSIVPQTRTEREDAGTWEQQVEWDELVFPQPGIHLPPEQAVLTRTALESPEMDRGVLQQEAERLGRKGRLSLGRLVQRVHTIAGQDSGQRSRKCHRTFAPLERGWNGTGDREYGGAAKRYGKPRNGRASRNGRVSCGGWDICLESIWI